MSIQDDITEQDVAVRISAEEEEDDEEEQEGDGEKEEGWEEEERRKRLSELSQNLGQGNKREDVVVGRSTKM